MLQCRTPKNALKPSQIHFLKTSFKDVPNVSSPSSLSTSQSEQIVTNRSKHDVTTSTPLSPPNRLHRLISLILAAVLDECLDELSVIGRFAPNAPPSMYTRYRSLEEKYAGERSPRVYDPNTLRSYSEAEGALEATKYRVDRGFLHALLEDAAREVRWKGSFYGLMRRLEVMEKEETEEKELLIHMAALNGRREELKRMLDEKSRAEALRTVKVLGDRLVELMETYEQTYIINEVESKYMEKWELSRFESCKYSHNLAEQMYSKTFDRYSTEIIRENRIHEEISKYLQERQEDAEQQTLDWMEKYEAEIDDRDMELMILKEKQTNQIEKMQNLKNLYEEHKAAIEAYVLVRNERIEEAALQELMEEAASKIQRWWRKVMFRRQLGPYRKKKGKGKDKKKKKG